MSDSRLPEGYVETDIAVVGMAGRFPGADSADALLRVVDKRLYQGKNSGRDCVVQTSTPDAAH